MLSDGESAYPQATRLRLPGLLLQEYCAGAQVGILTLGRVLLHSRRPGLDAVARSLQGISPKHCTRAGGLRLFGDVQSPENHVLLAALIAPGHRRPPGQLSRSQVLSHS